VLIRAADLLAKLEERRQQLMQDTFEIPPADYASFMKVVGRYQEIAEITGEVRKLSKQEDDK
jgi:hypothetical protein